MDAIDVITAKRDGHRLGDDQIDWFVGRYARGEIPDEQAAALAMAIYFRGMEPDELAAWTAAMVRSGDRLDLGDVGRPTVDKHSTGGVGDKISLVVVPLVAACGVAVPQLSGRGLGHTGGTLDKMESIPGWRAHLDLDDLHRQLGTIGCVIAGATESLAPADRRLYALRDVTGTVESIPLIASSIMSKKIAEGADALVLDVKAGSGAFMTERPRAVELAETMVELGIRNGVRTTALVTAMDTVLGRAVGNAVEVEEALAVLAGGGPPDVVELSVALATEMLDLAGVRADPAGVLEGGAALDVFERMVAAQGGDLEAGLPRASHRREVAARAGGWVERLDARAVGVAAWRLGAGRARKEDAVSATAGVICHVREGEPVDRGDTVLELRADDPARFDAALAALEGAIEVGPDPPRRRALVLEAIRGTDGRSRP